MRKVRKWLIAAIALSLLVPVCILFAAEIVGNALCATTAEQHDNSLAQLRQDGTLIVQGTMNAHLYDLVEQAVASAQQPLHRIWLNSGGGDIDETIRIGELLEKAAPAIVEVPNRATCQSACVLLLAGLPGQKLVAPEATLMFHEAARTSIAQRCGGCGWLRRWQIWRGRHVLLNTEQRYQMRVWAAELSDKLPILMDLCPINPLDTQDGITLTGRDLEALNKGELLPADLVSHCPRSRW